MSYGTEEYGSSDYGGVTDEDFMMTSILEGFGEMTAYILIQKPLAVLLEGDADVSGDMVADYVLEADLTGEGKLDANMNILLPKNRQSPKRAERPPANNEFLAHYTIKKRGE